MSANVSSDRSGMPLSSAQPLRPLRLGGEVYEAGVFTAEHPSPSATCRYQDETGFVSKKDAEDFAEARRGLPAKRVSSRYPHVADAVGCFARNEFCLVIHAKTPSRQEAKCKDVKSTLLI